MVDRTVDDLANVVARPGPVADLGCGPGAHALALARRGYDVVGIDGSPRMVEVARARAARDDVDVTFESPRCQRAAALRGCVARRCACGSGRAAPRSSRGLHRRDPALPAAGRASVDHGSGPRRHVAQVSEPLLAATRNLLPTRARRRSLLRHTNPCVSRRGPGLDCRRLQRRVRSRNRAGTCVTTISADKIYACVPDRANALMTGASDDLASGERRVSELEITPWTFSSTKRCLKPARD